MCLNLQYFMVHPCPLNLKNTGISLLRAEFEFLLAAELGPIRLSGATHDACAGPG